MISFIKRHAVTIIMLAVAILAVCFLLINNSKPNALKEAAKMVEITDNTLVKLIVSGLSDTFPIKNMTAHIERGGIARITGDISSRALSASIDASHAKIAPITRLIIKLMPDTVHAKLSVEINIDRDAGKLVIIPKSFVVNGFEVSGAMLPPIFEKSLSDAVNKHIADEKLNIGDVTIEDGKILINP